MRKLFWASLCAALASSVAGAAGAATYNYTQVDVPGAKETYVTGVNASGVVVGYYTGGGGGARGFMESNGVFTTISPYGAETYIYDINDSGVIAGETYVSGVTIPGVTQGFTGSNGVYSIISPPLSRPDSVVEGINNAGNTVGFYATVGGEYVGFVQKGGVYSSVTIPGSAGHPYLYGINNNNDVVGDGADWGFAIIDGIYQKIMMPGSTSTGAGGINDSDVVAGYFSDGSTDHGYVLDNGAFTTLDAPGATLTFATGINNAGAIEGFFYGADGKTHGFIATLAGVPEPAEWALFIVGFGVIGAQLRRRRSKGSAYATA